ncbi:MAG: hypothetical protein QM760_07695 [Nibricoccus sp.]
MAWVRFPHTANLTDCQPWWSDTGVRTRWTADAAVLASAKVIILPGSKNTLADLRWLRAKGLDQVIRSAAARGTLIIGLCGGYQMLGEKLSDPAGLAGDSGEEPGLGLLPITTKFAAEKIVRQITAECDGRRWTAYEIHMGRTEPTAPTEPLHYVFDTASTSRRPSTPRPEGTRRENIWGTYLHGWFESPEVRRLIACDAAITSHRAAPTLWSEHRQSIYRGMAAHLAASIDLTSIKRYLAL